MTTTKIEAHAKVNLTLEVLGVRPDGFHALRSVVLPIGLSDTLTFTPADEFSTDTGYPDDLILKAAHALEREVEKGGGGGQRTPSSYAIRVEKRIPAGGGLGGGSADAAATLLKLNELWRLGKTPEELAAVGAAVGSDVPALVLANHYRRPVLMEGRGEIVSLLAPTASHQPPTDTLVLANPGIASSTPAVYAAYDKMCDAPEVRAAKNQLQPPAVALYPEIGSALAALREAGARDAMMSGSGATVFGFAASPEEGRRIVADLRGRGLLAWVA